MIRSIESFSKKNPDHLSYFHSRFTYTIIGSDQELPGCERLCFFPCPFTYLMGENEMQMQWGIFMFVVRL
jgi:hypothetical protein